MSTSDAAKLIGVSLRAMHAIRRRHGVASNVGRPELAKPLTEAQRALVVEHMRFAERIAMRLCREKSKAIELEKPEYIGVAYLGLVCAASRWQRRGSFRALARKWIEGKIRDYRRADMMANGWHWETNKHQRMVQDSRRVTGEFQAPRT